MVLELRIILVEDLPTDAELIKREIRKSGIEFSDIIVDTEEDYINALKTFSPDLILSDFSLPGFDGMRALNIQQNLAPLTPFVLVTGSVNEETAVDCMKAGADDYVIKQNLKRLGEAIKGAIEKKRLIAEKKDVELTLRRSEERYRSLFENSAVPIFEEDFSSVKILFDELKASGVTDFRSYFDRHPEDIVRCTALIKIINVNSESIRFFQARDKQEIFNDLSACFMDETWPIFKEEIIALAEGNLYFECEIQVATFEWEHRHLILKLSVRPDCVDTLKQVLVSFVDITASKQAEAALAESEELFRTAFENATVGVCLVNSSGEFLSVNNALCNLLGYSKEELLSLTFSGLTLEEDKEIGLSAMRQMLAGEKNMANFENRYIHKNGSIIWTNVSTGIVHNVTRRIEYFVTYIEDITERKQAELTIRRSAELYCALTENMKDVIWILDPETLHFTYISPSCEKLVGYTAEEIMSRPFTSIVSPEYQEKLMNDMKKIISDNLSGTEAPGKYHSQVFMQPRKDGSIIWTELTAYSYLNIETGKMELRGVNRDITERRHAEELVINSEKQLRTLINAMPDIVCFKDGKGRWLEANWFDLNLFQLENVEYKGKTDKELAEFSPFYKEAFLGCELSDEEAWGKGILSRRDEVIPRPDGTELTFDVIKIPSFDASGNRAGMLVIGRDITERRKIEEELQKSEEKFRLLAINATDVIWTMDMNGMNTYISPSVERLRGYTPEEALLMTEKESLTPESAARASASLKNAIEKIECGQKFDSYSLILEQPCKDQSTVWVEVTVSGIYDENGKFVSFLGVTRDITERRKAEVLLQEKQFWLAESQRVGKIGSYNFDILNNSWSSSDVLDEIFGIESTFNRTYEAWLSIIEPDQADYMMNYFQEEVLKKRNSFNKEYKIRRLNDSAERWVWGLGELIFGEEGNPVKMIGTIQDITERKKSEEALISAKEKAEENDRLKTAFLNNISHEIRTPMNAIIGFSGFLNEPNLQPEKRKYFTEIICNASNQLLSIITDIINIATIETGQECLNKNKFNLNKSLNDIFNQFDIKAKNQQLNLKCFTPLPDNEVMLDTDETKLVQVLSNLIGNALKFTKQGQVTYGYTLKDNFLEFYVKDSGIGIPENMHEEIFERFRQADSTIARQYGGTGLGLSISKAYVELLGGTIWLDSHPGNGSTFYFTLPFAIFRNGHSKNNNVHLLNDDNLGYNKSKTILIAEDEDFNFMLLDQILSGLNLNLIRVMNGAEAVMACKSNPEIDMVIMDVKMPVMDGYEATRHIKKERPELPIMIQTAYARESDRIKAFECGCDEYVSKPLVIKDFLSLLDKHITNKAVS
jgi:PAS domain S-box-containing protein